MSEWPLDPYTGAPEPEDDDLEADADFARLMFMPKVSFRMASASHESAFRRTDQHGAENSSVRPHRGPVDHRAKRMLRTCARSGQALIGALDLGGRAMPARCREGGNSRFRGFRLKRNGWGELVAGTLESPAPEDRLPLVEPGTDA